MKQILCALCIWVLTASCRTSGDSDPTVPPSLPSPPALTETTPILKKVVGGLTKNHPDNRYEECVLLARDVEDPAAIRRSIQTIKSQPLREGVLIRAQVPSLEYFGFLDGEVVLLYSVGEKQVDRDCDSCLVNPDFDPIKTIFDQKCGAKDERP